VRYNGVTDDWHPIEAYLEYIAYRERFGPPPGVRGAPDVVRFR
jgi:hypothetical protein